VIGKLAPPCRQLIGLALGQFKAPSCTEKVTATGRPSRSPLQRFYVSDLLAAVCDIEARGSGMKAGEDSAEIFWKLSLQDSGSRLSKSAAT
jgi:hypothetical protein